MCWNTPDESRTGFHTRSHVLSHCARLHALGLWVVVEETFTYPAAVVLGLRIHGPLPPADPGTVTYHVFRVHESLITRITANGERGQALGAAFPRTAAGSGPASPWR